MLENVDCDHFNHALKSPGCLVLDLAFFHCMLRADVKGIVGKVIASALHHNNYFTPLFESL